MRYGATNHPKEIQRLKCNVYTVAIHFLALNVLQDWYKNRAGFQAAIFMSAV